MSLNTRESIDESAGGLPEDDAREGYRRTAEITECTISDSATWGVQFASRPSEWQMKGHALCWEKRIAERQVTDRRSAPSLSSTAPREASSSSTDNDEGEDVDRPMQSPPEQAWKNLFATVNGCNIRVYHARAHREPKLLSKFTDSDSEEIFYSLAWSFNADNDCKWRICAAGRKGVIRIVNVEDFAVEKSLIGHGEAVNDIKVHPRDPALVLSASKDESLRLWNIRTGSSIAVFAGLKGHRGEVVSVDFNRYGDKFASCGIDNSIRIWEISDDDDVIDAIAASHKAADIGVTDTFLFKDENESRKRITVPIRQFPCFVTRKVHKHYVDCVMFVGDLLLSKSVHNRIYLWEPGTYRESLAAPATSYTLLAEFALSFCNVWFIRFAVDRSRTTIACGNERGAVSLYHIGQKSSKPVCVLSPNRKIGSLVRQCAFSDDGSIILAVDDNSRITQYDRIIMPLRTRAQRDSSPGISD